MAALPTPPAESAAAAALARAERRLQAWATSRPAAAPLARLAALAVRVDAALLRRLRLQLLPHAEPGIEADLWWSGLHESQGRNGFVFDARVQQLLRSQLAAAGGPVRPLDQAWQVTTSLHAGWPEALRTEEALTYHALRGDGAAQVETLLAPALKAMAGGGDARALEVARWAQRAVPRLPDAARSHPSALALWLASLLRLGLPASQLPDTGAAGLPAALQWLLPSAQLQQPQRLALDPLDDAVRFQQLADGAPPAALEISLPRTGVLLLAMQVLGTTGQLIAERTLPLDAAAAEQLVPLPAGWHTLHLRNLTGAGWQLQREAGTPADSDAPLPWQRMVVQVLGPTGPVGMGTFMSPTDVVTVVDALEPALQLDLRADTNKTDGRLVSLMAQDAGGNPRRLKARAVVLDLRSPLVLLELTLPFDDAIVASRMTSDPPLSDAVWMPPGLRSLQGRWEGAVAQLDARLTTSPTNERMPPDRSARHVGLALRQPLGDLPGIGGGPVFVGNVLAGIADLASTDAGAPQSSTLWMVPTVAVDRFLAWARRPESEGPRLLLHHAVDDPYGKGAEMDEQAVQRIEHAARRARLHLVSGPEAAFLPSAPTAGKAPSDRPGGDWVAGVVRLVSPVTHEDATPDGRMRLLALAARRWEQPDFGLLTLGFRQTQDRSTLPAPLAGAGKVLQDIEKSEPERLARQLLDLAEPPDPLPPGPLLAASQAWLEAELASLARPFQRTRRDLDRVLAAARSQDLREVADFVVGRWNSSSRLDAVPVVELLAQLALPLPDAALLDALRAAGRGAVLLNAMPVQLARLLIARTHAGHAPPPCLVVRDPDWSGPRSGGALQSQLVDTLAGVLGCHAGEAQLLLDRLDLGPWVLVPTRLLPDADALQALERRLPTVRFLFLGPHDDLAAAATAMGAIALPPLPERADMPWMQGYKRLMEWARPRKRAPQPASSRRPQRAIPKTAKK